MNLIVYACPAGALAAQLERYFAASLARFGPNSAHAYMPHVTLTGFFDDAPQSVPVYAAALEAALEAAHPGIPEPPLTITDMLLRDTFHGLTIESPWLRALVADFAARADSPTRASPLRLKDWLHLSLAYGFAPEQGDGLAALARALVDAAAQVTWELRLYERLPDGGWVCHRSWPLVCGL